MFNKKIEYILKRRTGKYKKIEFLLDEGYVSCDMCALCYTANGELDASFCQAFSISKNPEDVEKNKEIASKCKYYVPKFMARPLVKTEEYEAWYEKDSMG